MTVLMTVYCYLMTFRESKNGLHGQHKEKFMAPVTEKPNLRSRQTAATREEIQDVAMRMLSSGAPDGFSHESIARTAGMGARTVYRHFPDRAELLQALWLKLRDSTDIKFPAREQDIVSFLRSV